MAMMDRPGTLPMIKCSNCGLDINIERLADHLCGPGDSTGRQTPRNFNDAFSNMSVNQFAPAPFRQKTIPRPIDSTVANVPFQNRPALPTGTPKGNRLETPITTRKPIASQTTARLPVRAPSPELTLPQECAFPPFQASQKRPSPPATIISSATTPGASNTSISTNPYDQFAQNPYAQYFQNDNTNHQISQSSASTGPTNKTPNTESTPTNSTMTVSSTTPQETSISESSINRKQLHARNKSVAAANRPLDEIGSFRAHRSIASKNGFSSISSPHEITRSASAQSHRYTRSIHNDAPPLPGTDDTSRFSIPRSASASGARDRKIRDIPPLPIQTQNYQPESPGSTRHTPSDSASSNQSEHSHPATSSSQSSPPTSNASMSPQRRNRYDGGRLYSSTDRGLGIDSDAPRPKTSPRSFSRPSYSQPKVPLLSPDTFETLSAGPWQSDFKKTSQQSKPLNIDAVYHSNGPYRDNPPHPPAPESPMDPALKGNRLPFPKTQRLLPPSVSDYPDAPQSAIMLDTRNHNVFQDSPGLDYPDAPRSAVMPSTRNNALAPSLMPRPGLHRTTTTSKGKCRGCGEIIVGKSVSSADGRLTGRWHKQCFACKTCSAPFPTMDFYVIGNDPYCNRHYHQLNKSLCTSCDRGIEGQYVDNDRQKFHPHCFTCSECHLILRDTYFDLNGKIFCERHAFKVDAMPSHGGSRRFPEKRSTRFMMI